MMNQISPPDAIPVATLAVKPVVDSGNSHGSINRGYSVVCSPINQWQPAVEPALEHHGG